VNLNLARGAPFDCFLARLQQDGVAATVPSSLPILFFGNMAEAHIATIGLNPSRQEYLSSAGAELDGAARRFETVGSLGIASRASIKPRHALAALDRMAHYFDPGGPAYSWFRPLGRVVNGFGASLSDGTAVHLDLVQEATDPVWSGMWERDPDGAESLSQRDQRFLQWQLEAFPIRAVLCTSRTVLDSIVRICGATVEEQGDMQRLRWSVGKGKVGTRTIAIAGWNLPLTRPTGLSAAGQGEFGALLRRSVDRLGLL
jgi:hypothetical protein